MADLPPVPDKVHMQRVYPFRRCDFCEDGMSLLYAHLWPYEPQAPGCPVHVSVNRHLWLSLFQMNGDTVCTCSTVCCHVPPLTSRRQERHRGEETMPRHAWISPAASGTVNQKVVP